MYRLFNVYRSAGEGGGAGDAGVSGGAGGAAGGAGAPAAQANAEAFATAVIKAMEERTARAENGVLHSMASQYGIPDEEAKAVLERYKSEKASKLPEAVQKQIDEANARVVAIQVDAEIKSVGASMGLLDTEAALALLPKAEREKIKVTDEGVTGVKEALEALQKSKPFLFSTGKPAAMAQRVAGGSPATLSGVEAAFYARNPDLQPKG